MTTAAHLPWFHLERETIRHIDLVERVERHPKFKTALLRWVFPISLGVLFRWMTAHVVDFVIVKLDAKSERFVSSAIWFEGAQRELMQNIVETGELPSADLLQHIDSFDRTNSSVIELSHDNAKALRELHRASRLAAAFERLGVAATRLGASVQGIKEVVIQAELGKTHLVLAKAERDNFLAMAQLISVPTSDGIDPDLLSLAEEAVASAESRSSANDEGWARRLSRTPL